MKRLILLGALASSLFAHDVMGWIPPYQLEQSKKAIAHKAGSITADQWLTRMGLQFWIPSPDGKIAYAERGEKITDDVVAHFRDWGKAHGVKVLLTVYNFDTKWNWELARSAFAKNRDTFVKSLVDEMVRLKLDGIDLDLEGEGSFEADRPAYASFVKALSTAVRAKGGLVTIDTFHSPCFNAPNMAWWSDWKGHVDALHAMGYGDLYEASTQSFVPEDGKSQPCANGAAIFKFSWQANWAKQNGFKASQALLGIPGHRYEWGGSALPKHLEDLAKVGAGCCVWDIPSAIGSEKDPRWGSEEAWKALVAYRKTKPSEK